MRTSVALLKHIAPAPAASLARGAALRRGIAPMALTLRPDACLSAKAPALIVPPPMRTNYIDGNPSGDSTHINKLHNIKSFRRSVCTATDVSLRSQLWMAGEESSGLAPVRAASAPTAYGDRVLDWLECRWAAKFYGRVTFGPRNYPYPSSRWLARRFQMKKHRILKRFRFRRYKLAAVANLPFSKMIRVGMLPELKSSKTKKGDSVDAGLSTQLVGAARSSSGGKGKGKRTRPKSKYQV